jgi:adhesin/invasin
MQLRTHHVGCATEHHTFARGVATACAIAVTILAAGACNDSVTVPKAQTPGSIIILSGDAQHVQVATNAGVPLTVEVHDKNNVPMAGATVTFSTTSNGGFGAPTAVTDSAGDASVIFTMGTVEGSDSVTATVEGVSTPVTFVLLANPGPAQTLAQVSTPQETGTSGAPLATPFEIKVVDIYGNPIAGVTVTWTSTGGSLSATSSVSDANGDASVNFTPTSGSQTVTANVANVPTVSFIAVGT